MIGLPLFLGIENITFIMKNICILCLNKHEFSLRICEVWSRKVFIDSFQVLKCNCHYNRKNLSDLTLEKYSQTTNITKRKFVLSRVTLLHKLLRSGIKYHNMTDKLYRRHCPLGPDRILIFQI